MEFKRGNMGLFDIFKKKEKASEEKNDKNKVVWDTFDKVCNKSRYGEEIEKLNSYERVIFVTLELECEVNNGGFSQYFYNSSGNRSNELIEAFREIGAVKTAGICKKALSAFDFQMPADREKREELLDEYDWETADSILEECDDKFYDYADELETLNYEYIVKNWEYFG